MRQRKLGELCRVAAVYRPNICARLARIAPRTNSLCRSDVCRINELVRAVKNCRQSAVLKYTSSSHPWKTPGGGGNTEDQLRNRGEEAHCGSMPWVACLDATYGDQLAEGKRQFGYVVGLMPLTLTGPRPVSQWPSKFTRRLVRSRSGGEVYALSEMVDHMTLPRDFYGPCGGLDPGMVGLEDCGSPCSRLKTKKVAAENYFARHFSSIRMAFEEGELDNAYWALGAENPADGLATERSATAPVVRLLVSYQCHFNPGSLRPLTRVAWKERAEYGETGN